MEGMQTVAMEEMEEMEGMQTVAMEEMEEMEGMQTVAMEEMEEMNTVPKGEMESKAVFLLVVETIKSVEEMGTTKFREMVAMIRLPVT
jgi:hypothetical protein